MSFVRATLTAPPAAPAREAETSFRRSACLVKSIEQTPETPSIDARASTGARSATKVNVAGPADLC
jgi:hypothetical protein